jgi:hypothetical protein
MFIRITTYLIFFIITLLFNGCGGSSGGGSAGTNKGGDFVSMEQIDNGDFSLENTGNLDDGEVTDQLLYIRYSAMDWPQNILETAYGYMSAYQDCPDLGAPVFNKNSDNTYKIVFDNKNVTDCMNEGNIGIGFPLTIEPVEHFIFGVLIDNLILVDSQGNAVELDNLTLEEVRALDLVPSQYNLRYSHIFTLSFDALGTASDRIVVAVGRTDSIDTPCTFPTSGGSMLTDCNIRELDETVSDPSSGGKIIEKNVSIFSSNDLVVPAEDFGYWYYFESGTQDFSINNWSGTITYTGANTAPTYTGSNGSQTINGNL